MSFSEIQWYVFSIQALDTALHVPPKPGVFAPKLVLETGEANSPPVCVVFCCPNRLLPVFVAGVAPKAEKEIHSMYLYHDNIYSIP